jgi:DNA-binding CsgD family transcriptional regulator/energy-coupling factor transporter ATP-binding protein EcfA2
VLVGRADAVAEVSAALRSDGRVVVVGTGGVGKSTLVRHVAAALSAEQTVWVDVDRLDATTSLAPKLLAALGSQALSGESDAVRLSAITEGRRLVVVLDGADVNVEEAVSLAAAIPTTGRGPWAVITSRVRPATDLVPVVRVAPFDLASDPDLGTAADLFWGWYLRAGGDRGSIGGNDALRRVLDMTGGIPLAIRVAAAATAATGLDATEARLTAGDGFEDLTRCIDRSVELLSSTEREVFDAYAVTAGSIDLDAVVEVSGLSRDDAVAALGTLVLHNLLEADSNGYRMLPPVHRSAVAHLGDMSALGDRCQAWCESMMDDDDRLLRHEADVRLVVNRLLQSLKPAATVAAMELTRSLAWAQFEALQQHVAAEHLRSVLDSAALHEPTAIDQRIELLRLLAIAQSESQGVDVGLAILDEADGLVSNASDPNWAAARLDSLRSTLLHNAGSLHDAIEMVICARESARAAGDHFNEVQSEVHEVGMLLDCGRLTEADAIARQVIAACDDTMASFAQTAQSHRAVVALERGDRALCDALGRRQLSEAKTLGQAIDAEYQLMLADPVAHADRLTAVHQIDPSRPGEWMVYLEAQASLATQALVGGDHDRAMTIASDIVVVAEALPLFWMRLEGLLLLGDAALVGGARRQAWMSYRTALALANAHGFAVRLADAVDGLAHLTAAGDSRRRGLAASAAIRAACDADRRPRPWLPQLPTQRSTGVSALPDGWVIERSLTPLAIDSIVSAAVEQPTSPHEDIVGRLSPAESRVAMLVAQGCTNREIGERLHISRRTVETHIVHAFQKLGVQNRTQLATTINTSKIDTSIA